MAQLRLPRLKNCSHRGCTNKGLARDGFCMNHTQTASNAMYTVTDINGMKNPIGMELECVCSNYDVRKITECVTGDGSLPSGGQEIKILADASKIGQKAGNIALRAKSLGARVVRQCGFHVHTSLPTRMNTPDPYANNARSLINSTQKRALHKVVFGMQNEAFDLFPCRLSNTYCQKIRESYDHSALSQHYSWVSFSGHLPTIEVRLHSGTLSPSKIYSWGKVCIGMQKIFHDVLDGKRTEGVKRAENGEFIRLFRKNSVARQYLEARKAADGRNVRYNMQIV